MEKMQLPAGIQAFRHLREEGLHYVDKTAYIGRLLRDKRKHFYLSRPRGFGKSMFVDTLKEVLEGNEKLFRGLAFNKEWDWSVQRPVIRLDYSGSSYLNTDAVDQVTIDQLKTAERLAGLKSSETDPAIRLRRLIRRLHAQSRQRIALLVDEYDKPIVDAMEYPEIARANGYHLGGIFGVIKSAESYIRLSFFTGTTRYSTVCHYSGLDNLNDISLNPNYSAVCGFTKSEMGSVSNSELKRLPCETIRPWSNDRILSHEVKVYRPQQILRLLEGYRLNA